MAVLSVCTHHKLRANLPSQTRVTVSGGTRQVHIHRQVSRATRVTLLRRLPL